MKDIAQHVKEILEAAEPDITVVVIKAKPNHEIVDPVVPPKKSPDVLSREFAIN
jgi:hypothetical protein